MSPPNQEVPEKKRRRRFTAQYKLRILVEAEESRDHFRRSKKISQVLEISQDLPEEEESD